MLQKRVCVICNVEKPIDEFYGRDLPTGGHYYQKACIPCYNERKSTNEKARRKILPEEKRLELQDRNREKKLKQRYGLTSQDIALMGEEQAWKCHLCGTDITEKQIVDHDHETGINRRLLCLHCNLALGHFRDSTEVMQKAIEYVQEYRVEKPGETSHGNH